MADRGQLRAETQRNAFSNTLECLFLKLQSIYRKVKLALNQLTPKLNSCSSKFLFHWERIKSGLS